MLLDAFRRTVPAGALQIVEADDALGLPIAELPDGSRARIDLRWAGLGFPRDVAAALGRTTRKADDTVLVVCAQALSDGSRRLLDELGVSWFGLDGAASLHIGTIWVARDARAAPPAPSVDFRWSAARADVAEVLLEIVAGGAAWQDGRPRVADVETLSRLSGRSLGSVSGTLAGLDTSGWTEPGPEPRSRAVADPSGLLDSWSGWQRRLPSTWASFHVLDRNPTRIEEQLASLFGSGLILTGSAVSERVRPMLTGMRPVTAYVDMDGPALDAAAARAQMLPAPAGSIRLRPAPSAVANTSRVVDGRREASPIRVYADLLAGSERDQEAADAYRSVELSVFA
ncbi:hypothetical protein BIU90_03070 [Curtobacterium sp. MCBA15_001]|nr:hypothetical protein BIU90_03070 [Curtobacterium sp. MCBA15_001]